MLGTEFATVQMGLRPSKSNETRQGRFSTLADHRGMTAKLPNSLTTNHFEETAPRRESTSVRDLYTNIGQTNAAVQQISTCIGKRALARIWAICHATASFLLFAQYGRRIKPCGASRWQPGGQHARGNQHTSRARERRRIAGLHLKQ